jgi:hypothetical protein
MVKLFIVATYQAENDARLEQAIATSYPDRHYAIGRGQWMIASKATATQVAQTLGILPGGSPFSGSYVVCIDEYFGRTRGEMGDWMDAKAPRPAPPSKNALFKSWKMPGAVVSLGKRVAADLLIVLGFAIASMIVMQFVKVK